MIELPELMDEKQVSERFAISLNTLRSWRTCGDGPDYYKLGTSKLDGTGNLPAVMDAMGHSKMDVTRLYQHPGLKEIGRAINKRNELVQ